jgi:hypothetical protein
VHCQSPFDETNLKSRIEYEGRGEEEEEDDEEKKVKKENDDWFSPAS